MNFAKEVELRFINKIDHNTMTEREIKLLIIASDIHHHRMNLVNKQKNGR